MLIYHDNYYSASELLKKSAAQIVFFKNKRQAITDRINRGMKFQHKVAEEKGCTAEEFRTCIEYKDIIIFACHDLITEDGFVEVKNIDEGTEVPQWFLESSLLQCAFYKSLLLHSNGFVTTPKFRIKEGYNKESKRVDINKPYILHIGNDEYKVSLKNKKASEKILEYFYEKAKSTINYDDARLYDSTHKFKHFEHLKEYFTYEKIN